MRGARWVGLVVGWAVAGCAGGTDAPDGPSGVSIPPAVLPGEDDTAAEPVDTVDPVDPARDSASDTDGAGPADDTAAGEVADPDPVVEDTDVAASDSADPVEADDSSAPVDSGASDPVDPVDPVDPGLDDSDADPVDPIADDSDVDPVDPIADDSGAGEPVDSADPVEPIGQDSGDSNEPVEPVDPIDPVDPVDPADPSDTSDTAETADTAGPAAPADTAAEPDPAADPVVLVPRVVQAPACAFAAPDADGRIAAVRPPADAWTVDVDVPADELLATPADLDGDGVRELAVVGMHRGDGWTRAYRQAWVVSPGPGAAALSEAPTQAVAWSAPCTLDALAAVDLHGDGADDLWLSSRDCLDRAEHVVHTAETLAAGDWTASAWSMSEVTPWTRQVGRGDLDHDGVDDLIRLVETRAGWAMTALQPDGETVIATLAWPDDVEVVGFDVGDLDGDGRDDLAVAQRGATDEVIVLHGPLLGDVDPLAATTRLTHPGTWAEVVTVLGDVDGDGSDDLAVGLPTWAGNGWSAGRTWLFHGPFPAGSVRPSSAAWATFDGTHQGAGAGWPVRVGDVDGDNLDDLAIAAPGWSSGSEPDAIPEAGGPRALAADGLIAVFVRPPAGALTTDAAALVIKGAYSGAGLAGLAPVGDVDGDGLADLAVRRSAGWDPGDPGAGWQVWPLCEVFGQRVDGR